MSPKVLFILLLFLTISCKKEDESFISRYQQIYGTWKTQSISYDSSGIQITKSSRYNKLVINNNLTYKIYLESIGPIENGSINIISQTKTKLEIYFDAKYPPYSSYIGSHLFGLSNVILIFLSNDEMVFKSVDGWHHFYPEYYFKKQE